LFFFFGTEGEKHASVRAVHFMASAAAIQACVGRTHVAIGGVPMARPNYNYEKRQKELAKQKKNEEKRLRKMAKRNGETPDEESSEAIDSAEPPETTEATDLTGESKPTE
jgi:hypothetical protein